MIRARELHVTVNKKVYYKTNFLSKEVFIRLLLATSDIRNYK